MTRREETDIVDRIYEAAAIPDMWPGVLDAISDIAGGVGGLLFASDAAGFRSVGSRSLDGIIERYVAEGWPTRQDSHRPHGMAGSTATRRPAYGPSRATPANS